MTRRRRLTVAFEALEDPRMRQWRHAAGGLTVDEIIAEPRRGYGIGKYWCAACWTDDDHGLVGKPVFDGTEVPEDAKCEDCFIKIRDLQQMLRPGRV